MRRTNTHTGVSAALDGRQCDERARDWPILFDSASHYDNPCTNIPSIFVSFRSSSSPIVLF